MNKVNLWGYTVFKNGDIYNSYGKKMKVNKEINICWGKNKNNRLVSYARFVYYAFNYKNFNYNDKKVIIKHINGNKNDNRISNLVAVKRKDQNHGENSSSSKLTNKQVEEIIRLYNEKDLKEHKNNPKTNMSYRKIANMYGVSHTTVEGIIKGVFRNEEKYIMK